MKKAVIIILILSLCISFCACGAASPSTCEHDYYLSDYSAASNTADGFNIYTCKKCGFSYREIIPALTPAPTPPPILVQTPSPTPTPTVDFLRVYWFTFDLTVPEITVPLSEGDITVRAQAYPLTVENPTYTWTVDREGIIELTPNEDGSECTIHLIGDQQDDYVITVSCNGVTCTLPSQVFQ